jgi:predicted aconitase
MPLALTEDDRAALAGERGKAVALSMRIVTAIGEVAGAARLLDVESAHVDGCLDHGEAGLDFARRLSRGGARVTVPTTLNVSSLDLLHPGLVRLDAATKARAAALMDAYTAMGCRPTWTCAPYQLAERPGPGAHVAWAESNAVVFANSVLGARTERYGDFIDICCAVTGRAPASGLHLDGGRLARFVVIVEGVPESLLSDEAAYAAIGHVLGRIAGGRVPALVGLDPGLVTEDHLKALGAAAASSGALAMFHAVGITPESPTLAAAAGGARLEDVVTIDAAAIRAARDELSTIAPGAPVGAVSVGTPHCSLAELRRLADRCAGARLRVPLFANTGRGIWAQARADGTAAALEAAGVQVVTDTCTYVTPLIAAEVEAVVTNSGKWAWYGPGNLGVDVALGTLDDCVGSAEAGRLMRDEERWGG